MIGWPIGLTSAWPNRSYKCFTSESRWTLFQAVVLPLQPESGREKQPSQPSAEPKSNTWAWENIVIFSLEIFLPGRFSFGNVLPFRAQLGHGYFGVGDSTGGFKGNEGRWAHHFASSTFWNGGKWDRWLHREHARRYPLLHGVRTFHISLVYYTHPCHTHTHTYTHAHLHTHYVWQDLLRMTSFR